MSVNKNSDPRYKPNNIFPSCYHHAGGGVYYSDACVCYMSDGRLELLVYLENENLMEKSGWQQSDNMNASVECWMEC